MPEAIREPLARPGSEDAVSRRWLRRLRSGGLTRYQAVRDLHRMLLRMAYSRLVRTSPPVRGQVLDELANEAADEATVRVLAHLDDFCGESRFSTWACQFALTEASVSLRRFRRRQRELTLEPEAIVFLGGAVTGPERTIEQAELLRNVCEAVSVVLSVRQRQVLVALAVQGEPADALASELATNPGALYKNLHDARRRLRGHLAARGLAPSGEQEPDDARG